MIRAIRWWIGIGLLVALGGCGSFPRIIFLHDPLTPQEHLQLGIRYESQKDWASAEKEYRAALDQDPRFLPALANLGNLYAQQGQYKTAEEYYRRVLKDDPNHPMANNNLAVIYIKQGARLTEAEELIDRALAADPQHRAFYMDTRALLLLRLGQPDEARKAAIESESAPGSDSPAFREQHALTRFSIDAAAGAGFKSSPAQDRTGSP